MENTHAPIAWAHIVPEVSQIPFLSFARPSSLTNPNTISKALFYQSAIDAAVAAERERCAVICDGLASKHWQQYKRSGGTHQGDPHTEGQSDGADECALEIRGPNVRANLETTE